MADAPAESTKILFAMLRHTQDGAKLKELLPKHLAWMQEQEKAGRVFLSGTTDPAPGSALNGLTIMDAGSREAAEALAKEDPLISSGAVTYVLHT